jgi:hypothetical protein
MFPVFLFGGIIVLIALAAGRSGASEHVSLPPAETPKALEAAEDLQEQADIHKEIQAEVKELPPNLPSPFPGVVGDEAWRKYVKLQRQAGIGTITKSFLLGMFLLGMRVLEDVGMAKGVKLQDFNGRQVFRGDFVPPITQARFLSDATLQYEAFKRMTAGHARYILAKYPDVVKEGHTTLSGLLGVAKQAGLAGMDKWLTEQTTRKESTTAAFKRVNGIF